MPRFFPTTGVPTRLVTAQGSWDLTPGLPLDVDRKTAHILREAFRNGGVMLESAASPPSSGVQLAPGSSGWTPYGSETLTWGSNNTALRVQSSAARPGATRGGIPAEAGATYRLSMGATVSTLGGAQGWYPFIEFLNGAGTVIGSNYTQASSRVTTSGVRTITAAVAPASTATIRIGFELGANGGPTTAKDFTVTDISLTKTASAAPVAPLWKVDGAVLRRTDNNQRVVMRGATLWTLPMFGPWADFSTMATNIFNNRAAIVSYMSSIRVNVIRVGVSASTFANGSDGTQATILQRAADFVDTAATFGIQVLFTFWDDAPTNSTALNSWLSTHGQFYAKVGTKPNVMWNPLNEPHEISNSWWETMNKTFVDYYRDTLGYKGVLVLDPNAWANDFGTIISNINAVRSHSDTKSVQRNILWSHHLYANGSAGFVSAPTNWNGVNRFESEVGTYLADYPIAMTETGTYNGSPASVSYPWNVELWDYTVSQLLPRGFNGIIEFNWLWADNSMVNPGDSGGGVQSAASVMSATSTQMTTLNTNHGVPWKSHYADVALDNVEVVPVTNFNPPIVDTFNRANSDPPSGWTAFVTKPSARILSNQLAPSDTTNNWGAAWYSDGDSSPYIDAAVDIFGSMLNGNQFQMFVGDNLGTAQQNAYVFVYNTFGNYIAMYRNDTFVQQWTIPALEGGVERFGFRRESTTWKPYVYGDGSWRLLGSVSDTNIPWSINTGVGVGFDYGSNTINRMDNFRLISNAEAGQQSGSGQAMPSATTGQFTQVLAEDFNTNVALGSWASRTAYTQFGTYNGALDTRGQAEGSPPGGTYQDSTVLSVANSLLDWYVHTDGTVHKVATITPANASFNNQQTYGRYNVRLRADAVAGYKVAFLLWPTSGSWPADGEIDFPEASLDGYVTAASHFTQTPTDAFAVFNSPSVFLNSWHTYTTEWTPGRVIFYVDGSIVGVNFQKVPYNPMYQAFQVETNLSDPSPTNAANGHVQMDWATIGSWTSPGTAALAATFTEAFTTLNTAKWWTTPGAGVNVTAGQLRLPAIASYSNAYQLDGPMRLTGSTWTADIPTVPTGAAGDQAGILLGGPSRCNLQMYVQEGVLMWTYNRFSDGAEVVLGSVAYNATNHRRWRILESGGTISWQAATAAGSFSTLGSVARTTAGWPAAALDTMHAHLWCGNWNGTAGRPDMVVESIN